MKTNYTVTPRVFEYVVVEKLKYNFSKNHSGRPSRRRQTERRERANKYNYRGVVNK